jgi:ABC-2 type transport system ATP-binding protein
VQELNRAGMTVIYTTHYMEEAQRLCHRVAIVDEGQIISLDTPAALIRGLGGGIIVVGLASEKAQGIARQVAQLPSVQEATRSNGSMKIKTHRAQDALVEFLNISNQRDVRITSLEILEPNLESVFLHLTGKKLRQ